MTITEISDKCVTKLYKIIEENDWKIPPGILLDLVKILVETDREGYTIGYKKGWKQAILSLDVCCDRLKEKSS